MIIFMSYNFKNKYLCFKIIIILIIIIIFFKMIYGDWGLGIGDWGLGIGDWDQ